MRHGRRVWVVALLLLAGLAAALTIFPEFGARWARFAALPALNLLHNFTQRLPFVLAEWLCMGFAGAVALHCLLYALQKGPLRAIGRLFKRLGALLCLLLFAFLTLWLPLYRISDVPVYAASQGQLIASCQSLIAELNARPLDFSRLPEDLPAKAARFPFWMDALKISGIFSFFTGEALIHPELADCAVPFVAVHEHMHALGHAGEDAANLAAWEACMRLGGLYADSARLWALKYSMSALYAQNPQAYADCRRQMNNQTFSAFRQLGGGRRAQSHPPGVQAVFAALGMKASASDYEILAAYLASGMPE